MRIAFSSLGCPDWNWGDIIATAKDLGYDGIELRGIEHQMVLPKAVQFIGETLEKNKLHLKQIGLTISCLTSACYLHDTNFEAQLQEGMEYLELAAKLEVPFVRVLGDTDPVPGFMSFPRAQVIEGLQELGKAAKTKGITFLIETNGHLADSKLLADLLEEVDEPGIGVLWDIHHPYRFFNEAPQTTVARLGKAIKYLHVKDSRLENGKIRYCMMGEGDIPIRKALAGMLEQGYKGWISLEWVKRWNPDIEEPGIVFPHFISTIQRYLKEIVG